MGNKVTQRERMDNLDQGRKRDGVWREAGLSCYKFAT
jgi:hypothetical protein